MNMQTVHVRVNDAETGQPTPCRVRFSDSIGHEYAPFGQSLEFSTHRGEDVGGKVRIGRERWFTIAGACEVALPAGEVRVQVRKGLTYRSIDQVLSRPAGKMSIRLAVRRERMPFPCAHDSRCHFLTPHTALLDGAAEGLNVVNLLAEPLTALGHNGQSYTSIPNLVAFSGQAACLEKGGTRVFVTTHHKHRLLGSLGLLHCHRVIHPLTFGPPDEPDDWSLADWAGQCHRKGGLVVWTEPFASRAPFAGEALALAVLGEIDCYEFSPDHLSASLPAWYRLLNAGVVLPLVGSSARAANDRPLGALQTVTNTFEGDDWVGMVKLGSGRVTNGPVPNVCLDGNTAYASAISLTPFERLELLVNGRVAAQSAGGSDGGSAELYIAHLEHDVTPPAWVAARVVGPANSADSSSLAFGHTSVVQVGEPQRDPASVAFVRDHLQRVRDWVTDEGRFTQEKSRQHLLQTIDAAVARLGTQA